MPLAHHLQNCAAFGIVSIQTVSEIRAVLDTRSRAPEFCNMESDSWELVKRGIFVYIISILIGDGTLIDSTGSLTHAPVSACELAAFPACPPSSTSWLQLRETCCQKQSMNSQYAE